MFASPKGGNSMGRKKKTLPPTKSHRITVRLTEDMHALLISYAKNSRVTPVEYIRGLILGKVPPPIIETSFDCTELLIQLRQLGYIRSNLNQIAKHLSSGGTYNEDIRRENLKCISCIYEIRDDIKKMTGEYHGDYQTFNNY